MRGGAARLPLAEGALLLGVPKVADLDLGPAGPVRQQSVLQLDVAVRDAARVREGDSGDQLLEEESRLCLLQPAIRALDDSIEQLAAWRKFMQRREASMRRQEGGAQQGLVSGCLGI